MKMNKHIELPITEPMYGTYHHQGPATAIDVNGNAAKNWCLNQAVNLMCGRRFLNGLTTPELSVPGLLCWERLIWNISPSPPVLQEDILILSSRKCLITDIMYILKL